MWTTHEILCHFKQWLTTIYETCKHFTTPKSTPDDKIIIIMKLMKTRRRMGLDHIAITHDEWALRKKESWERHKNEVNWLLSMPTRLESCFFLETVFSISWHLSGQELVRRKKGESQRRLNAFPPKLDSRVCGHVWERGHKLWAPLRAFGGPLCWSGNWAISHKNPDFNVSWKIRTHGNIEPAFLLVSYPAHISTSGISVCNDWFQI